jgi:hypothetical protein
MAIFGNQSSDINASFNVSNNIKDLSANVALRDKAMFDMAQKFSDTNDEMAQLRATTGQIISQYGVDEKGRPSDSAPKYVHDIYKGIQKEGGIEGLPKSSLIQAIKGYETGFQLEGQKQNMLRNQQANELAGIQLQQARLQAEQQAKIIKASEIASEVNAEKKGKKTITNTGVRDVNTGIYGTQNMQEGLDALTAPQVGSKVNYSKQSKFNPADTLKGYLPPETKQRDELEAKLNLVDIGEKNAVLKQRIAEAQTKLKEVRDATIVNQGLTSISPITGKPMLDPARWLAGKALTGVYNMFGDSSTDIQYDALTGKLSQQKTLEQIRADKDKEEPLLNEIAAAQKQIKENEQSITSATKMLPVGLQPAVEQPVRKAPNVRYPTSKTQTVEYDKTEDEIVKEEYGMLTSRLKSLGQLPLNWSENTFREIKGYAPKVEFKTSNGVPFVGIGGKWELASGMTKQPTISESIALEKQSVYKSAIRSDRLSDDRWEFQGDMRVEDANTAGKIGREAKDLTRSLDALDRLIDLGSTGKWESLLPTEKAGLIDALTNSVRAAGRTEIAGSGAFSEKDADYLNSIVPSFASMSGAVFREQAIAKLTEYRNRIQMKVQDFGKAYGFSVQQRSNTGLSGDQEAELKLIYSNLLKQGVPPEQAKQMAIQSLYSQ